MDTPSFGGLMVTQRSRSPLNSLLNQQILNRTKTHPVLILP